ncbi:hypothetical protein KC980_01475 [candidate division WWE3 bacterium]|uniref:Baseplate protein J-like domain-containing protein n=1 Tax=candidate division WWE3 bacterium TaxID=2053526 RepID=A0A955EAZ3_UNCKA|nr:hypothetical protein [candidate division WWE3 bacterium]
MIHERVKVVLEMHDDVVDALEKIRMTDGPSLYVEVPEGSVLFDNILNLKLLQRESDSIGKDLRFHTEDPVGRKFITQIQKPDPVAEGFVTKELYEGSSSNMPTIEARLPNRSTNKSKLPKLSIPAFKLPNLALLKVSGGVLKWLVLGVLTLLILGIVGYYTVWSVPKAHITIKVESRPLPKSVTIRVENSSTTNSENKILAGSQLNTTVTESSKANTTGTKEVGEKATGSVKLYNRTNAIIEVEKGTILTFKDKSLDYVLKSTVEVPAQKLADPTDPASVSVPGEKEVSVEAKSFGSSYNIDEGETLELDDYKRSELAAVSFDKFEGGSTNTVKVVTQEDLDNLSKVLSPKLSESAEKAIKKQSNSSVELIAGSVSYEVSEQKFSHKVDDEAAEVELTQTVVAKGLGYSPKALETLIDSLASDFVPDGFELSDKDKSITVEVLGNSDDTVLNSTQADLQVTLRSFIVTKVDTDKIASDLAGKSLQEAQKILGGIRDILTYNLEVSPSIPLLSRVPSNIDNITIEVERVDD